MKIKSRKAVFVKELSNTFKFFFYVIGCKVITYHLITYSNKRNFFHGCTVASVSRPPQCRSIMTTLRPTTFSRSPL
jgi:hypothetical protein